MTQHFFTADTHFGHGNIIKYCHRPFLTGDDRAHLVKCGGVWHRGTWRDAKTDNYRLSDESVEMMDNAMIGHINSLVGKDDILWHLGDFAMAPKSAKARSNYYQRCRAYRDRINCRAINIVWGNHDRPELIRDLFEKADKFFDIKINAQRLILCHYAMVVWPGSHRRSWQLYGHSHGGLETFLDNALPGHRSLDVGVDNAYKLTGRYRPLTFAEIADQLSKRLGLSIHNSVRTDTTDEED